MRALRFEEIPSSDEIASAILECVRANQFRDDMHLRIHAFGSDIKNEPRGAGTDLLIIPEPRSRKSADPVHCRIAAWRRPPDDSLPSRVKAVGNRMFARVAAAEAKADGYDQILLLNERGKLAEALSSNLFVVRHGIVCTPAITADILEGITRASLLAILADDMNQPAQEREIDRSELLDCEEAFLCSTGLEILPIATVDRLAFNRSSPGPITSKLTSQYQDVLRGKARHRAGWLTPVY
jgi:branched-chain amino acid aminotransferase